MRTERSYYAKFDDGHDYHFVNFTSTARKGSADFGRGDEGMIPAALLAHLEALLKSGKRVVIDYNKKTGTFYIGTTKMEKWEEIENGKEV